MEASVRPMLKKSRLGNDRIGDFDIDQLITPCTDPFEEEKALAIYVRRRQADDDWRFQPQTVELSQTAIEQAADLGGRHVLVVEGRQQIQDEIGLVQGRRALQQRQHLMAGERPA